MVEKDQSLENKGNCRLRKFHYGNETFSLQPISKEDIFKAVKRPSLNKACISNDIRGKIIKNFASSYCEKLKDIFNKCLQKDEFPNLIKETEITSVLKNS